MLKTFIYTALLFSLLLISSAVKSHDYATPEDAVNAYIQAVKTGSGELVKMAFQASASIQYYNQEGEFKQFTREEFANAVNTGNEWDASINITSVRKSGFAANATVEFVWGKQQQHAYTDYLNIIYDGKSWHISDKVAQYKSLKDN